MSTPSGLTFFPSLFDIATPYKGILLDAHGVFWGGNRCGLLPGSKKAMKDLVSMDKQIGILSNSTELVSKEIEKLKKHGLFLGEHFHFLLTSGQIAKETFKEEKLPLATPNNTFYLFCGIHPEFSSPLTLFEGSPYKETKNYEDADFTYISIPHINGEDQINPNLFLHELQKLKQTNLPMVCANPDRFALEGFPPRPVVRQGSLAAIYEDLGGQVIYIGKPSPIAYSAAMDLFKDLSAKDILMVGDTPETDIQGANNFGMFSALITKTGIMADRIENLGSDQILYNLATEKKPSFFIERLGIL